MLCMMLSICSLCRLYGCNETSYMGHVCCAGCCLSVLRAGCTGVTKPVTWDVLWGCEGSCLSVLCAGCTGVMNPFT